MLTDISKGEEENRRKKHMFRHSDKSDNTAGERMKTLNENKSSNL